MTKSRSLFDIINGTAKKPAKVKQGKQVLKQVPIGHLLAIKVYYKGVYLDVLFADHVDICNSYTMIHYNERCMEEHPQRVVYKIQETNSLWVEYEDGSEFDIIRIS